MLSKLAVLSDRSGSAVAAVIIAREDICGTQKHKRHAKITFVETACDVHLPRSSTDAIGIRVHARHSEAPSLFATTQNISSPSLAPPGYIAAYVATYARHSRD